MLTKNFLMAFPFCLMDYNATDITLKGQLGTAFTLNGNANKYGLLGNVFASSPNYYTEAKGAAKKTCIAFGDGDSPESEDDYQLSGKHLTTFTASCVRQHARTANEIVITYTFTITNTGTEAFTIREVGAFYTYSSNASAVALLDRQVLPAPVTIEATGVGQVVYTVKFPTTLST